MRCDHLCRHAHRHPVRSLSSDVMAEARTRVGQTVAKTLFAMSGNQCYFPGCEERMGHPSWKRCNGEIAHICGERKLAARYDPTLSVKERNSHENLMLLCPTHHKLIDQLRPDDFPVDDLRRMKAKHEARTEHDWADEAELTLYVSVLVAPTYEQVVSTSRGFSGTAEPKVGVPSMRPVRAMSVTDSAPAVDTATAHVNVEPPAAGATVAAHDATVETIELQGIPSTLQMGTLGGKAEDAPDEVQGPPPQTIRAPSRAAQAAAQLTRRGRRGSQPPLG